MSVEQIYLYAETVAAGAVVASVIYLGVQIRQGTKASRAEAVATLLSQYDSPTSLIAGSRENARVFRLGCKSGEELDADEKIQFEMMVSQYFTVYHTAFCFHRDGILPDAQWHVFRRDLVEFTDYPGWCRLLPYYTSYYSPDPEFLRELGRIEAEHLEHTDTTFIAAFEKEA
jgi:hypothetical protein